MNRHHGTLAVTMAERQELLEPTKAQALKPWLLLYFVKM